MSVLVFLHGHDDDADTWAAAAGAMAPDGWTVVRPTGPVATAERRSWFGADEDGAPRPADVRAALDAVAGHLRKAAADHGVAPDEVALAGFSQGGALALLYATAEDDIAGAADRPRPAAVVAVASWLPDVDGIRAPGTTLATDRLLIAHGRDDDVVPFPLGRSVARLLERRGHPVTFVEDDTGHDPAPFAAEVRAWLTSRP